MQGERDHKPAEHPVAPMTVQDYSLFPPFGFYQLLFNGQALSLVSSAVHRDKPAISDGQQVYAINRGAQRRLCHLLAILLTFSVTQFFYLLKQE